MSNRIGHAVRWRKISGVHGRGSMRRSVGKRPLLMIKQRETNTNIKGALSSKL
jgi:hypothetical protein